MGFAQTTSDPCLYVSTEGELFVIAVYVDDIVLAGRSDRKMSEVKKALATRFDVKDIHGRIALFYGCEDHSRSKSWKSLDWSTSICREYPAEIQYGECKVSQHAS